MDPHREATGQTDALKSAESEKSRWSLPRMAYLEQKFLEFPQHVNRNLGELLEAECAPAWKWEFPWDYDGEGEGSTHFIGFMSMNLTSFSDKDTLPALAWEMRSNVHETGPDLFYNILLSRGKDYQKLVLDPVAGGCGHFSDSCPHPAFLSYLRSMAGESIKHLLIMGYRQRPSETDSIGRFKNVPSPR